MEWGPDDDLDPWGRRRPARSLTDALRANQSPRRATRSAFDLGLPRNQRLGTPGRTQSFATAANVALPEQPTRTGMGEQFTRGLAESGYSTGVGVANLLGADGVSESLERGRDEMREYYGEPQNGWASVAGFAGGLVGTGAQFMGQGALAAGALSRTLPALARTGAAGTRAATIAGNGLRPSSFTGMLARDAVLNTPLNAAFAQDDQSSFAGMGNAFFGTPIPESKWGKFGIETAGDIVGGGLLSGAARGAGAGHAKLKDISPQYAAGTDALGRGAQALGDDFMRTMRDESSATFGDFSTFAATPLGGQVQKAGDFMRERGAGMSLLDVTPPDGPVDLPLGGEAPRPRLRALHNTRAETLRGKIGGTDGAMPFPSLAVVREDIPFSDFGDITLLGRDYMAHPGNAPVYDVDAYTVTPVESVHDRTSAWQPARTDNESPMRPEVDDAVTAFDGLGERAFNDLPERGGDRRYEVEDDAKRDLQQVVDHADPTSNVLKLTDDIRRVLVEHYGDDLMHAVQFNQADFDDIIHDTVQRIVPAVRPEQRDATGAPVAGRAKAKVIHDDTVEESARRAREDSPVRHIRESSRDHRGTQQMNGAAMLRANSARQFDDLEEMRGEAVRRQRPRGESNTAISKGWRDVADAIYEGALTRDGRGKAYQTPEYGYGGRSIEQEAPDVARYVRSNRSALVEGMLDDDRVMGAFSEYLNDAAGGAPDGDALLQAIKRNHADVVPVTNSTPTTWEKQEHIDWDNADTQRIAEALHAWHDAPTDYFEAKFDDRPLNLEEFAGATVPDDLPPDVRALLEKHGLPLEAYNRWEDGDATPSTSPREHVTKRRHEALQRLTAKLEAKGDYSTAFEMALVAGGMGAMALNDEDTSTGEAGLTALALSLAGGKLVQGAGGKRIKPGTPTMAPHEAARHANLLLNYGARGASEGSFAQDPNVALPIQRPYFSRLLQTLVGYHWADEGTRLGADQWRQLLKGGATKSGLYHGIELDEALEPVLRDMAAHTITRDDGTVQPRPEKLTQSELTERVAERMRRPGHPLEAPNVRKYQGDGSQVAPEGAIAGSRDDYAGAGDDDGRELRDWDDEVVDDIASEFASDRTREDQQEWDRRVDNMEVETTEYIAGLIEHDEDLPGIFAALDEALPDKRWDKILTELADANGDDTLGTQMLRRQRNGFDAGWLENEMEAARTVAGLLKLRRHLERLRDAQRPGRQKAWLDEAIAAAGEAEEIVHNYEKRYVDAEEPPDWDEVHRDHRDAEVEYIRDNAEDYGFRNPDEKKPDLPPGMEFTDDYATEYRSMQRPARQSPEYGSDSDYTELLIGRGPIRPDPDSRYLTNDEGWDYDHYDEDYLTDEWDDGGILADARIDYGSPRMTPRAEGAPQRPPRVEDLRAMVPEHYDGFDGLLFTRFGEPQWPAMVAPNHAIVEASAILSNDKQFAQSGDLGYALERLRSMVRQMVHTMAEPSSVAPLPWGVDGTPHTVLIDDDADIRNVARDRLAIGLARSEDGADVVRRAIDRVLDDPEAVQGMRDMAAQIVASSQTETAFTATAFEFQSDAARMGNEKSETNTSHDAGIRRKVAPLTPEAVAAKEASVDELGKRLNARSEKVSRIQRNRERERDALIQRHPLYKSGLARLTKQTINRYGPATLHMRSRNPEIFAALAESYGLTKDPAGNYLVEEATTVAALDRAVEAGGTEGLLNANRAMLDAMAEKARREYGPTPGTGETWEQDFARDQARMVFEGGHLDFTGPRSREGLGGAEAQAIRDAVGQEVFEEWHDGLLHTLRLADLPTRDRVGSDRSHVMAERWKQERHSLIEELGARDGGIIDPDAAYSEQPWTEAEEWVTLTAGAALMDAAERGVEYVQFPTAANRQAAGGLKAKAGKVVYEAASPRALKLIFKSLGLELPKPRLVSGPTGEEWVRYSLDAETRNALRRGGVPMLGIAGVAAGSALSGDDDEPDDEFSRRVFGGPL